jgi:hypothetical protein
LVISNTVMNCQVAIGLIYHILAPEFSEAHFDIHQPLNYSQNIVYQPESVSCSHSAFSYIQYVDKHMHITQYSTSHKKQFMISIFTTCFGTGVPSSGREFIVKCVLLFVLYCMLLSSFFLSIYWINLNLCTTVSARPCACPAHNGPWFDHPKSLRWRATIRCFSSFSPYLSRPATVVNDQPSYKTQSTGTKPEICITALMGE